MTLYYLDLIGTTVFAYSGAACARAQRFSILGVFYCAFMTAIGGGTLRHIWLRSPELFWIKDNSYLFLILLASVMAYLPIRTQAHTRAFQIAEFMSTAIFTAVGVNVTIQLGYPITVAAAMGALSGLGGGVIRDVITGQRPKALTDPKYPVTILGGTLFSITAVWFSLPIWLLSLTGASLALLIPHQDQAPWVATAEDAQQGTTPTPESKTKQPLHKTPAITSPQEKPFSILILQSLCILLLAGSTGYYFWHKEQSQQRGNQTVSTGSKSGLPAHASQSAAQSHIPVPATNSAAAIKSQPKQSTPFINQRSLNNSANRSATLGFELQNPYAAPVNEVKDPHHGPTSASPSVDQLTGELQVVTTPHIAPTDTTKSDQQLALADIEQNGPLSKSASNRTTLQPFEKKTVPSAEQVKPSRSTQTPENSQTRRKQRNAEMNIASHKFSSLARAIELRNINLVESLTDGSSEKDELFRQLFDKFVMIDLQLKDIQKDNKTDRYTALIQLTQLRLPNGSIAYPAAAYRHHPISIRPTNNGWSKIRW